ncbi:MAG: DUF5659 domain-containing protein [Patescibacteria group bacterium]
MSEKHYKTSSFYLTAYLLNEGLELVNIDRTNPKRALFVFIDRQEREGLVQNYNFGQTAMVDARKYALILRELKAKLYMDNL